MILGEIISRTEERRSESEIESRCDMISLLVLEVGFIKGIHCDSCSLILFISEFMPEYAGKMNYYLSVLDRTERLADENPSIGIILCAEKDHVQVELALEDMGKPIGVADYQLIIPKEELRKAISDEIAVFESEQQKNM